ncbi:MAG: hypothetical protein WCT19_00610, partial [Candidatus Paceibacterota bacterium]
MKTNKNWSTVVVVVIAFLLTTFSVFAENEVATGGGGGGSEPAIPSVPSVPNSGPVIIPDKLPTESLAVYKSYAKERVAKGYVGIWSEGLVSNPNSKTYSEVSFDANQDTFSKLVTLGKEQLRFEVAKPALNNINVYASLSDSNGNTLFYGNKTSRLVKTGDDGWKLPDNAFLVEMDAIDQLPIEF